MNWKPTAAFAEILIIAAIGIGAFLISAEFDILEWIVLQSSIYENFEIDELVFTLNVIAIALGVFSFRRWREVSKARKTIEKKNKELEDAFNQIESLKGILPICSFCSQIRDDDGDWHQVEDYFEGKTEALFSHGICPDCANEHYPEFAQNEELQQTLFR
jgi:two-component system sensor histidine kinase TtrS